jgi:hypothetical protein
MCLAQHLIVMATGILQSLWLTLHALRCGATSYVATTVPARSKIQMDTVFNDSFGTYIVQLIKYSVVQIT